MHLSNSQFASLFVVSSLTGAEGMKLRQLCDVGLSVV